MKKVFLGGTCNNSTWRNELIPLLKINYFNPVVDNWDIECQVREIIERKNCDFCLYTITTEMRGTYSIAEAVDDSNKRPEKTILCILKDGFNQSQLYSLQAVANLVVANGGKVFYNLKDVSNYLNS